MSESEWIEWFLIGLLLGVVITTLLIRVAIEHFFRLENRRRCYRGCRKCQRVFTKNESSFVGGVCLECRISSLCASGNERGGAGSTRTYVAGIRTGPEFKTERVLISLNDHQAGKHDGLL